MEIALLGALLFLAAKGLTFSRTLNDLAALVAARRGVPDVAFYRDRLEPGWLTPSVISVWVALAILGVWVWDGYGPRMVMTFAAAGPVLLRGFIEIPPRRGSDVYMNLVDAALRRRKAAAERDGDEESVRSFEAIIEALVPGGEPVWPQK